MIDQKEDLAYARFMRGLEGEVTPKGISSKSPLTSLEGLREKVRSQQGSSTSHQPSRSHTVANQGNSSSGGFIPAILCISAVLVFTFIGKILRNNYENTEGGKAEARYRLESLMNDRIVEQRKLIESCVEAGITNCSVPGVVSQQQTQSINTVPQTKWGSEVTPSWYKETGMNRQRIYDGFKGDLKPGSGVWMPAPGTVVFPQGIARIDGENFQIYLPNGEMIQPHEVVSRSVSGTKVINRGYFAALSK